MVSPIEVEICFLAKHYSIDDFESLTDESECASVKERAHCPVSRLSI